MAQLRTGHARLNSYLHRIGQSDSDVCECGVEGETVEHFLLRCARWNGPRRALIEAAGPHFGSLSHTLGGKPETVDRIGETRMEAGKPDMKMVKAVIVFAMGTKRLANEV